MSMEKQLSRTRLSRHRKGGVFSFDAASAFIVVALMVATGTHILFALQGRAALSLENQALIGKVFSVSDYLVKEGAVRTTESEYALGMNAAFHHEIDEAKLVAFDSEGMRQRLGMKSLSVELVNPGGSSGAQDGGNVCVTRPCIVAGEIRGLRVCGS